MVHVAFPRLDLAASLAAAAAAVAGDVGGDTAEDTGEGGKLDEADGPEELV
jgi:hypothetical protein